jgi:hypothetical protein
MSASITQAMGELDRYEAAWASPGEAPAGPVSCEQLFAWLERRLGAWDARLTEAGELAASVEKQLAERESALSRWHGLLASWRDLVQREGGPPDAVGGPGGSG